MSNVHNLPTEKIDLPSRGLLYPEGHPLAKGYVEVKYPTAKEEDILTNINYLNNSVAIDKFLESILVDKTIDLDDLLPGDKDAIQIAGRILGYGPKYSFKLPGDGTVVTVDLSTMKEITLDESMIEQGIITRGVNEFIYKLPSGEVTLKYRMLTGKIQKEMDAEIKGMKKNFPNYSASVTMFLKYAVTEVNGSRDTQKIRDFIDRMRMSDSSAFRQEIARVAPGYVWEATGKTESGEVLEGLPVPFTVNFFWPTSGL